MYLFSFYDFFISWTFYTFIFTIALIFLYLKIFKFTYSYKIINLLYLFSFIFGIYAFITPDYYSYILWIESLREWDFPDNIEYIYALSIPFIEYNYFYFRVIIISISFIILFIILKKYSVDIDLSIIFFILILLLSYCNTIRSSISETFFYLGAFIYYKNKNLKNFCFLIILYIICCILHKSGFLLAIPFVLSLLKFNKKSLLILLLFIPFTIVIGNYITNNYFLDNYYTNKDNDDFNSISVILIKYFINILYLIIAFICFKNLYNTFKFQIFNKNLYKFCFWGIYLWISLNFINISTVVGERFFYYILFPIVILLSNGFRFMTRKNQSIIYIIISLTFILNQLNILSVYRIVSKLYS